MVVVDIDTKVQRGWIGEGAHIILIGVIVCVYTYSCGTEPEVPVCVVKDCRGDWVDVA